MVIVVTTESHPAAFTKVVVVVPALAELQVVKLIAVAELCNRVVMVVITESHPTALTKVVTTVPAFAGVHVVKLIVFEEFCNNPQTNFRHKFLFLVYREGLS